MNYDNNLGIVENSDILVMANNNNNIYSGYMYIRNEVAADITSYLAGTITGCMTECTDDALHDINCIY